MQNLNKVIFIRHAIQEGGNVTPEGIGQMQNLASILQSTVYVDPTQTVLISSSSTRAVQSSEALSERLGITFTQHDELSEDYDLPYDLEKAFELISQQECSVLIVLTHMKYTHELPDYTCRQFVSTDYFLTGHPILKNGEMMVIDLENLFYENFQG